MVYGPTVSSPEAGGTIRNVPVKPAADSAPALAPLPPVEQIRPGLWVVPVPIPMNSLRYVLVYVFATERGAYLIDAGWNTDEAFDALSDGLKQAGFAMSDVRGVMVTHIHPDHYGLAGRIREASGAWISLHPADARLIESRYIEPEELLKMVSSSLTRAGAPAGELADIGAASMPVRDFVTATQPDVLLEDGDRPDVPGWNLRAIHTPGHSPGHLCFYLAEQRLMLTGDHVLPRITPNISYHPQSGPNPLGDFLDSLDKVAREDVELVLPAHEHRFVGLTGRVDALKAHHHQRFSEVIASIGAGEDTAFAVAANMSWSRSWDRIDGFMRRAAVGEALAHLYALRERGILAYDEPADPEEPIRWHVVDGATLDGATAKGVTA
jgi:glyoxylase-like metal-dependent hydrolase (beta-lactamase superfamily II)